MADLKDLSKIIDNKGQSAIVLSSANLQSEEEAKVERDLRQIKSNQDLKKEWVLFIINQTKDLVIFSLGIFLILRIDIYAFSILQENSPSESKIRFAIAALTATVSSLLSYLVGRSSK